MKIEKFFEHSKEPIDYEIQIKKDVEIGDFVKNIFEQIDLVATKLNLEVSIGSNWIEVSGMKNGFTDSLTFNLDVSVSDTKASIGIFAEDMNQNDKYYSIFKIQDVNDLLKAYFFNDGDIQDFL